MDVSNGALIAVFLNATDYSIAVSSICLEPAPQEPDDVQVNGAANYDIYRMVAAKMPYDIYCADKLKGISSVFM